MQTIKLVVEDAKLDIVLDIIQSLKEDVIKHYEILNDKEEENDFINISNRVLESVWDNAEDADYDKFLKV
jgi:ribose 5-phosphate isomerase RpiB